MELTVKINLDNAALQTEDAEVDMQELARILSTVYSRDGGQPRVGGRRLIRDANGNLVGHAIVTM